MKILTSRNRTLYSLSEYNDLDYSDDSVDRLSIEKLNESFCDLLQVLLDKGVLDTDEIKSVLYPSIDYIVSIKKDNGEEYD